MDPTSDWPCTPSLSSSWPLDSLISQWPHAQRYACRRGLSTSWSSPMALPVAYHESLWLLQLLAWTPDLSSLHLSDPPGGSSTQPRLMATLTLAPQPPILFVISLGLMFTSSITLTCIPKQYTRTPVSPAAATTDTHTSVVSLSGCWHSPRLMSLGFPCTWRWTSFLPQSLMPAFSGKVWAVINYI